MSDSREAADVGVVIDVPGRRAHQHQLGEAVGLGGGGEDADHGGDGVADEDHIGQVELAADLQHVLGVAPQRPVPVRVVGRQVRAAGAHVIEEHHLESVLEPGSDEPPHVLVAPEAVGEDHRLPARCARDLDVVASLNVHRRRISPRLGTAPRWALRSPSPLGRVAELADALASGASVRKDVGVQVPPRPPCARRNPRPGDAGAGRRPRRCPSAAPWQSSPAPIESPRPKMSQVVPVLRSTNRSRARSKVSAAVDRRQPTWPTLTTTLPVRACRPRERLTTLYPPLVWWRYPTGVSWTREAP